MKGLIGVSLALSVIGGILVLFAPFGGMSERFLYSDGDAPVYIDRTGYACLGCGYSEPMDIFFIVLLAMCIFAMAGLSLRALISKSADPGKLIRRARILAFSTIGLAAAGALVFHLVRVGGDYYYDWWLDTGFYAALTTGILNSIFYSIALPRLAYHPGEIKKMTKGTTFKAEAFEAKPVGVEPVEAEPPAPTSPAKELDYIEKLKKLAQARDEGILSQEEFEKKKKQILGESK